MTTDPAERQLTAHEARNRATWDAYSDEYQAKHGAQLAESGGRAWGTSQIPEAELRILGDVAGQDILELGCGAAQWSIALAQAGARPGRARPLGAPARARPPADGRGRRRLPAGPRQRRGGAAPRRVVRHRLLRPRGDDVRRPVPDRARGGATAAPRRAVRVQPPFADRDDLLGARRRDGRRPAASSTISGCTASTTARRSYFQLPYGEWIRLFRANGFVVEDLIEPRPPEGATSSYRNAGRAGVGAALAVRGDLAAAPSVNVRSCRSCSTSRTRRSPGPCSRSSASRTRSRPR